MGVLKDINNERKSKLITKIIIITLFLCFLGGFFYYYKTNKNTTQSFNIAKVLSKDISQTLSTDGKVYYKEQYELNFQTTGILKNIFKKQGDLLKSGEVIAKLDETYLQINLDKAFISLKNAQANLNAKLATKGQETDINISKEQLLSNQVSLESIQKEGEISLQNAQNNLDNTKLTLENNIENVKNDIENSQKNIISKEKELENAKVNLETTIQTENLNINNALQKAITDINITLPLFKKYLRDVDVIVGVSDENKSFNDNYEIYLGAKDSSLKGLSENSYRNALDSYNNFITNFDEANKDSYQNYIDSIFQTISLTKTSLENTRELLKNSISSSNFSQTTIDSYITNIENNLNALESQNQKIVLDNQTINASKLSLETKTKNMQNSIDALVLQIEQANTNLEKTKSQAKTTLDDLKSKYTLAQINLNQAKTKLQSSIDNSISQINISKANLDNKTSTFDKRELEPYYVAIENAKKSVQEATEKLKDATLKSPIDGKLAKLSDLKIGSNISLNPTTPFAIVINKDSLYVEAKVEEGDINNIFLGQKVSFTFNSIENLEIPGKVTFISDKAEIDNNGIVTYTVEMSFDTIDPKVKEGFTTQIYFLLKEEKNVLVLPNECIKTVNNISSVTLKDGSIKNIELGISNSDETQILKGLNIGDEVRY